MSQSPKTLESLQKLKDKRYSNEHKVNFPRTYIININ